MSAGPITDDDVRAGLAAVEHDKVDAETEGPLWLSVFVAAINARLRARPTASEEAIEAAARDLKAMVSPDHPRRHALIGEDSIYGTIDRILRRHFGASDTGGGR